MPVIRDDVAATPITPERRKAVSDQLSKELSGAVTPDGPVVFVIPLEQAEKMDVLVVWDAWEPFRSEDRSTIILEAFYEERSRIAQALGVTYREALEQQVLPYAVIPMVREGEVDVEELKKAMIAEGGIALADGRVDLRFPTMSLATRAHRNLWNKMPDGHWSISYTIAGVP